MAHLFNPLPVVVGRTILFSDGIKYISKVPFMIMTSEQWLTCEDPVEMLTLLDDRASPELLNSRVQFLYMYCRGGRDVIYPVHPVVLSSLILYIPTNRSQRIKCCNHIREIFGNFPNPVALPPGPCELVCPDCGVLTRFDTPLSKPIIDGNNGLITCGKCRQPVHTRQHGSPWITSTVIDLVRTVKRTQQWDRMPILGDALEDAGCTNELILEHCRSGTDHVMGCWVCDLLMPLTGWVKRIMSTDNVMRCDIDLDWCTYTCPCGASLCTRFASDQHIAAWKSEHKPHTNGKVLEHTTEDGMRAWGNQIVSDELKDLE